jgi:glycerate dehydrogenase
MNGSPFRVAFLDAHTFGGLSLERFTRRWDTVVHGATSPSEVVERVASKEAVVVNKVKLSGAVFDSQAVESLKLIVIAATGTDNVDLEAARRRGIAVANVPGYATQSVAQFTLALILELACRAGSYGALVRDGGWAESPVYTRLDFPIVELSGKKLGIVGHGRIGRAVAALGRAFGMEVLVSDRPAASSPPPAGRVAFKELLALSDIVALHCPLLPETRLLISRQALESMKPTAFLVNTARGDLVDEAALLEALKSGRLAGAALDVLSEEPPAKDHPVVQAARSLENLIVTPHCAWGAREARERLLHEVEEIILSFNEGRMKSRVA